MIIWINGSFGAGKTQTSYELNRRIKHSFVFDPERFGFRIQKDLPKGIRKDDFQDYSIWRTYIAETLRYLDANYEGVVIVPMTLIKKEYFYEIITALQKEQIPIKHFSLLASEETIQRRLRKRGDGPGSWNAKQVAKCVAALSDPLFETHIQTESKPIAAVAEEIGQIAGIPLTGRHSKLSQMMYQIMIQIKHIR
ncbi:AAA family ATPase [Paenibacillus eucommiae]|uniref:Gluconate kinase n=1 Tax=Paenibacillus eucommiae TaxID=1355755 RepID=A0ABS4J1L6_9BACL|nr:AAA family ATPase [Paenibacillus eucommiae]MBP1993729.1 gluconate kinase [Paenibacillus eucommiae]